MLRALSIASRARIGVYDCLYVALAELEGCELVTADTRLLNSLQPTYPFIIPMTTVPSPRWAVIGVLLEAGRPAGWPGPVARPDSLPPGKLAPCPRVAKATRFIRDSSRTTGVDHDRAARTWCRARRAHGLEGPPGIE
jgi:hypothetical protein